MLDKAVNVLAHLEEIRLFPCLADLSAAVGAFAVRRLSCCEEGFAGGAIPALVEALVYIALIVEFLEYFLNRLNVVIVGGADEVIVACAHKIPDALDLAGNAVNVLLGCDACLVGKVFYFLTVLVGTRTEEYILTHSALKSCEGIGHYDLVGVTEMRLAGCISNRGCEIKFFHFLSP